MNLPRIVLGANSHRINALVARSEHDRAQGLMQCTSLEDNEGMLFVHDEPLEACFWMKNTPMHLSIAFIDEEGRILNVAEMAAESLEGIRSEGMCLFVLEMSPGWFAGRGVVAGSVLDGLPVPGRGASGAEHA
jgi:uncharacterized membrane protein (UPF0127 family)